jgi:hypothetical protein
MLRSEGGGVGGSGEGGIDCFACASFAFSSASIYTRATNGVIKIWKNRIQELTVRQIVMRKTMTGIKTIATPCGAFDE